MATTTTGPRDRLDGAGLDDIWAKYLRTRDLGLRNGLVERYFHLVHEAARVLHGKLPASVVLGDLLCYGGEGLLAAIELYDTTRGARFETFARMVIWGRMMDGLRSSDHASRAMRLQAKKLEEAAEALRQRHGRAPTTEEVCTELGLNAEMYQSLVRWVTSGKLASMSASAEWVGQGGREVELGATLEAPAADRPDRAVMHRDMKAYLLKQLSREERLILVLYYGEGMTQKEVGLTLGVSESRVCQMLLEVRGKLERRFREVEPV